MKHRLILAAGLVCAATAGLAQTDVIKERVTLMKNQGAATGAVAPMLKGDKPFDLSTVQKTLDTYLTTTKTFGTLFPDTSKTGDTGALPTIWEKKDAFLAQIAAFEKDVRAAQVAIKDEASFKSVMPTVLKDCGECHTQFRGKRPGA